MTTPEQPTAEYWDDVADSFGHHDPSATWRAYMQAAYRELMDKWFADAPPGATLKTDLFEEAITPHHLFGALGPNGVGMDVSLSVVRAAAQRLTHEGSRAASRVLVCDVRSLPLESRSFARILSGSSLDHFASKPDIALSLAELARCLTPGGVLIVTFDNPHNPLVRLRNGLPFKWLSAAKLVPYYVGATYSRADITREAAALGLQVTHMSAIVHVPRAPAIWIASLWERWGARRVSRSLLRAFRTLDGQESMPWRFRSGYYLAARIVKPAE